MATAKRKDSPDAIMTVIPDQKRPGRISLPMLPMQA
jgi:hypothetical protein